jgi:hypothetical protein
MADEPWKEAIRRWQALSPDKQHLIRLRRIPRNVAESMAFEGEPVPQGWVEEQERLIEEKLKQEKKLEGDGPE